MDIDEQIYRAIDEAKRHHHLNQLWKEHNFQSFLGANDNKSKKQIESDDLSIDIHSSMDASPWRHTDG